MFKKYFFAVPLVVSVLTSGCATLGENSEFACKAPEGVSCNSLSGTYANAIHHNLPSQNVKHNKENLKEKVVYDSDDLLGIDDSSANVSSKPKEKIPDELKAFKINQNSGLHSGIKKQSATPILTGQKVLRVTVFGWEDSDKVLHDSSDIFIKIDTNDWNVPHVKPSDSAPSFGSSFGMVGK